MRIFLIKYSIVDVISYSTAFIAVGSIDSSPYRAKPEGRPWQAIRKNIIRDDSWSHAMLLKKSLQYR